MAKKEGHIVSNLPLTIESLIMDEKTTQFLPFHAINEFMRDDYRAIVVRSTLNALSTLPAEYRDPIDRLTKKNVQVPGFRISTKAPVALRLKPSIDAFIKQPQVAAAILSAWAEMHSGLRSQVHELLVSRGWEILPPETDRTKLPGFMPTWPKEEDFEKLITAFKAHYPSNDAIDDDISLMVVWISGRLPYQSPSES
jgi:hypothetical protein